MQGIAQTSLALPLLRASVLVDVAQEGGEIGHVVDGLRLEAFLEEVAVATVLAIVVVDVAAGNALEGFSHGLFALSDEQVEVV